MSEGASKTASIRRPQLAAIWDSLKKTNLMTLPKLDTLNKAASTQTLNEAASIWKVWYGSLNEVTEWANLNKAALMCEPQQSSLNKAS